MQLRKIKEEKPVMAGKLAGKVAVVTGAGSKSGIGEEASLAMAAEGAKVVVNDIVKDPDGSWGADRVVKEIKSAGGTAVANYDSVASMAGGQKIIRTAISNFGRIDILVNSAGNFKMAPTVEFTEEDWDAILNVHLKGLFATTREALKEMIKQKSGGRIINFTSVAAYSFSTGPGASIAYCTAKGGVLGFTRMLALEMKEHGVTANSLSPIATTALNAFEPRQPGPEYVAPMIVYLSTDEAKDITGQIIYIMGGDVCVYAPPMGEIGRNHYLHKSGKWTVDELIELMPRMVIN
jgi:NAD(P)-dependent dehydrogenase (short-subunit alcohol dehydrogenase family)